jgi:hypothetical protein
VILRHARSRISFGNAACGHIAPDTVLCILAVSTQAASPSKKAQSMSQTNQQIPQLVKRPRMQVNPPVFFISAALILVFVLFTAVFPKVAGNVFDMLQAGIVRDFGWFYILSVAIFLMFVIFLMLSRYGDVKLGPDDSEPELPRHGALVRQRPAA